MPTVVIPFAGAAGKTRLHGSPSVRQALSEAMLADVVAACGFVGPVRVITEKGGQGPAVAAALADIDPGPLLLVNADVPCVTPDDVHALLAATPTGGVALVEAADGTTNALSLPGPDAFAPLYGAASADRFRAHADALGLECVTMFLPNLTDDVDTLEDLQRVLPRCGARTRDAVEHIPVGAPA